jgi:hypothetical protein
MGRVDMQRGGSRERKMTLPDLPCRRARYAHFMLKCRRESCPVVVSDSNRVQAESTAFAVHLKPLPC